MNAQHQFILPNKMEWSKPQNKSKGVVCLKHMQLIAQFQRFDDHGTRRNALYNAYAKGVKIVTLTSNIFYDPKRQFDYIKKMRQ